VKAWRAVRWALAAGLLLSVGSGRALGADLAEMVAAYLRAGTEQAPGAVNARAYLEPTRPTAPPTPQPDVSVVLLPYSAQVEAQLDAVKVGLRDSVDAYPRGAERVEAARTEYERALVAAGGGARLRDLPPGDWLLLAWREGGHHAKRFKLSDQDAKRYPGVATNVTYSTVTFWRSRLAVRPGETVEVAMSDRNQWMTAGRQESSTPAPGRRPDRPPRQR
jgi:hypothetical protein